MCNSILYPHYNFQIFLIKILIKFCRFDACSDLEWAFIVGPTKDLINGYIYTFVITSFFAMQGLAEWKKFKIKNESASNDSQSTVSGVVKKTGKIYYPNCLCNKSRIGLYKYSLSKTD